MSKYLDIKAEDVAATFPDELAKYKDKLEGKSNSYALGYIAARKIGYTTMRSFSDGEKFLERLREGGRELNDHDYGWAAGLEDSAKDGDLVSIVPASRLFEVKFLVATPSDASLRDVKEWIAARIMPLKLSAENPLREDNPPMTLMPPDIEDTGKYVSYRVVSEKGVMRIEVESRDTPYRGPDLQDIIQSAAIKSIALENGVDLDDEPTDKRKH